MSSNKDPIVLIVDDEPDLLSIVAEELSLHGFQVLSAETTAKALEILTSQKVDVVLSDVRMPGEGGLELFEKVKGKIPEQIPFLFMTGFPDLSVDEAIKKGARAMILKPFHLKELVEFLKQNLNSKASP